MGWGEVGWVGKHDSKVGWERGTGGMTGGHMHTHTESASRIMPGTAEAAVAEAITTKHGAGRRLTTEGGRAATCAAKLGGRGRHSAARRGRGSRGSSI